MNNKQQMNQQHHHQSQQVPIHIQDQESQYIRNQSAFTSQQYHSQQHHQNQYAEEYGTDAMEYTPSQNSNRQVQFQLSEPSIHSVTGKEAALIADPTEALINAQYNMLLEQNPSRVSFQQPNDTSSQQHQRSTNTRHGTATPGFQSLDNSIQNQALNMPLQQQQNNQAMVERLSEKLRSQAERLQILESYKLLCERRIKDLDPSHHLPVMPQHIGQKQMTPQTEFFQNKINELQNQLMQQQDFKIRLQQAEESLRQETMQNEEQRAYIRVLKENLEMKLNQNGLVFKGVAGIDSNVEGYMQLINSIRMVEQLKSENMKLVKSINEFQQIAQLKEKDLITSYNRQVDDLKIQVQTQQQQLLEKIQSVKDKKKKLKQDKNQLLDFVEDSLQKKQLEEQAKLQQENEKRQFEEQIQSLSKECDVLKREKQNSDDLIKQTQTNLRLMREDKEKLNSQIVQLSVQCKDYENQIKDQDDLMKDMENQLKNQQNVIFDKDQQLQDTQEDVNRFKGDTMKSQNDNEREIRFLKDQLKDKQQTLDLYKTQLDEQFLKTKTFQDANTQLQKTLQETQDEFDRFVKQYEQINQSYHTQEREFVQIKKQMNEMKSELEERTKNYNEMKAKDSQREKEIGDLYSSIGQKDQLVKDCEKRLIKNLKEKEQDLGNLLKKYQVLEQEYKDQSTKVEFLERINDDKTQELSKMKQTTDLKKTIIDDLQRQLRKVLDETENDKLMNERTLSFKLNEQERKEIELNLRFNQTQDELKVVKEQKSQTEKILYEKIEHLRIVEQEMIKKEEKLKRWEKDIQRLESKLNRENEKSLSTTNEFERLRSQKVDDALLIEKMKETVESVKDNINEVVGVFTAFQGYLDSQDNQNLSKEITQLYEQLQKMKPLKNFEESVSAMKEIKLCITSLITYSKTLRRKESTAKNNISNSPPQRDEWNVPQRIEKFSEDELQRLQATNENMRTTLEQMQIEREKQLKLKNKVDILEDQMSIDKQHINELECLVRKILQLKATDSKISKVLNDLFSNTKDIANVKYDRSLLTGKLQTKELRFHALNKVGVIEAGYQRDMGMLKGSIERERQEVKELDLRIDEHKRRQTLLDDELMSIDNILSNKGYQIDIETHGLVTELEELKKTNKTLQQEKEWNEKRLIEMEDQINRFNMPFNNKNHEDKSPAKGDSESKDSSRLQWPKLGNKSNSKATVTNQNFGLPSRLPKEEFKAFGQLERHHQNYLQPRGNSISKQIGDSVSIGEFASKNFQPKRNLERDFSNMNNDQPNYTIKEDNYRTLDYMPSQVHQSYQRSEDSYSGDQASLNLKDKMQKVKTIFSSLKRNMDN